MLFGKLRTYQAKVAQPDRNGPCVGAFRYCPHATPICYRAVFKGSFAQSRLSMQSTPPLFCAGMPRADRRTIGNMAQPVPLPRPWRRWQWPGTRRRRVGGSGMSRPLRGAHRHRRRSGVCVHLLPRDIPHGWPVVHRRCPKRRRPEFRADPAPAHIVERRRCCRPLTRNRYRPRTDRMEQRQRWRTAAKKPALPC